MPAKSFTRTELHQLIWSKPLNKLSAELGLSDVGLKKLCKRHDIPTPPQGHWISIHHGRSRPAIPLPPKPEDEDPRLGTGLIRADSDAPALACARWLGTLRGAAAALG